MIDYQQATKEFFDLQKYAVKLGLDNITTLTTFYKAPQQNYPSIHIAGTNGKGSTAFYIAQILQACGLKVGLFTSPHLKDFRERIRINDVLIDKNYIIDFWLESKGLIHKLKATFFDTTTLMAFKYFSDKKVDIAVIETGLGGRLDSTNILEPESIVLTPVGFDHQKQLGSGLLSIAGEKAGIIKKKCNVFISQQDKKVTQLFLSKTYNSNNIFLLEDYFQTDIIYQDITNTRFRLDDLKAKTSYTFELATPATYQVDNFALAFLVVKEYFSSNQIKFDVNKIKSRISTVIWPGRLQVIQRNPNIILDVSHNLNGIAKTLDSLFKIVTPQNCTLLLGIVNDKDAQSICDFLSGKFRKIIVTEPATTRKQDGKMLTRLLRQKNQKVEFIKDLQVAYEVGKKYLKREDTLIALGSHYLIGSLIIS